MSGNVWQWCSDWFSDTYYNYSETDNPEGPKRDAYRVCRGGSWWSEARDCRISNRDRYPADARDDDVGFRIAITEQWCLLVKAFGKTGGFFYISYEKKNPQPMVRDF